MVCKICGKEFQKSQWYKPYNLICSNKCFSENFWREIEQEHIDKNNRIIINGNCYIDGGAKDKNYRGFLGFGGREFIIKFFDGRELTTNNLWDNGIIPENHRVILKDNAEFLNSKKHENENY